NCPLENENGEGTLFGVVLVDKLGEIRATAFDGYIDKFYDKLEKYKAYYISNLNVILSKKSYNLENHYEMYFDDNIEIKQCNNNDFNEDDLVNLLSFNFFPLDKLTAFDIDSYIDVIGVVKKIDKSHSITTKATKKRVQIQNISIADKNGHENKVTLWGNHADTLGLEINTIVEMKFVHVTDYK
ncbi:4002_t:CDS:2, partial [Entrophospora sp. SA101]